VCTGVCKRSENNYFNRYKMQQYILRKFCMFYSTYILQMHLHFAIAIVAICFTKAISRENTKQRRRHARDWWFKYVRLESSMTAHLSQLRHGAVIKAQMDTYIANISAYTALHNMTLGFGFIGACDGEAVRTRKKNT
jgi:hypothetical protein